jgi:N-methylhydantoinase B
VEALELEFPLRVVAYRIRRGSGGDGAHRGGDGVVRELEALSEMTYSLIAERRRHPPPGAAGGMPGACGRDAVIAADTPEGAGGKGTRSPGKGTRLPGKAMGTLRPGERLRIETPGGGGHGRGMKSIKWCTATLPSLKIGGLRSRQPGSSGTRSRAGMRAPR